MQLQSKKKPKGRRFTIDEKILSLSLYKKSPKAYKHLCSYFSLPSIKAMKRLLGQIKLTTGINPIIFEKIKKTMAERDAPDRLCSLIFDEVSLTANITYNAQTDEMQGFANNKPDRFANHALVFMVKGVKCNFKQPVAYYFTNALDKIELKKIIKTVVKHVVESGLIIVNTVCDQSTVNVGAITELVQESRAMYLRNGKVWRNEVMHIAGQKIIPLYDVPHLIKGVRNNLLTKDLIYTINNSQKIVKWEYFQMIYAADKSYGELRLLDKITEEHVNPEKINKMRVKHATQIFSHSMAVVAEHLTARGALPEDCRQIIDITLLLDNLFDTLNGSTLTISPNGKIYKGPVKQSSPHHHLWKKAKEVLKTVKFIKKVNVADKIHKAETTVPSVTNFIKTIEGMEALWELLSGKYKLDAMLTRHFNQDPLENFFGNIRSYGARNVAPNSVAFEGAYKALMLNNYSTPHSRGANCEEDVNECLQTLEFFIKEKIEAPESPDVSEEQEIHFNKEICLEQPIEADSGQRNYVCGWVLKKCLMMS
ncbi:hypothetical protein HW555_013454 [Spodoptera exigua]|nr:hypothetical protein HW555_013454 [Spodoptera exigua]